ncbi:MAG: hypothetical protein WCP36_10585 [Methanomicrobiales archaeon]
MPDKTVEFPPNLDPSTAHDIIETEKKYSKYGLIAGIICVVFGVALFLLGVTGAIDWSLKVGGAESTLTNAAPGVVLAVIGFLIIFVTKPSISVKP